MHGCGCENCPVWFSNLRVDPSVKVKKLKTLEESLDDTMEVLIAISLMWLAALFVWLPVLSLYTFFKYMGWINLLWSML